MDKTKLIKLLSVLSTSEFKKLHKSVESPLFTTNVNVVKLYKALRPFYPSFDSPKLTKSYLYTKVFSREVYRDGKMRKLMTELTQVVEDFLIYLELQKEKSQRQQLLTNIYGQRNLYPFFEKSTFQMTEYLDSLPHQDESYYWQKMKLEQDYFFHPITPKIGENSHLLSNMMDNLDNYYMMAKFRLACEVISRTTYLKGNYDLPMLSVIQKELSNRDEIAIPYQVYLCLIELLRTQKNDTYWETRAIFFEEIDHFNERDKKNILHYLFNFSIAQVNKGNSEFRAENFELYKFAIQQNLLIENGYMSDMAFTNIASYGASFHEFEWTEKFIKENNRFLPKNVQEEATQLSLAYVAFFQKNNSKTIDLLLPVIFRKTSHNRRAKSLLLRSYFELSLINESYFDLFFSFTESYQKLLYRNSIDSKDKIQSYLNLVKYLKRIANIVSRNEWTEEVKEEMRNKVVDENMVLKSWLLKRLDKL